MILLSLISFQILDPFAVIENDARELRHDVG
jgi:hypothetical protein